MRGDGVEVIAGFGINGVPAGEGGVAQLVGWGRSSIGRAEDFESSDPVFESRSPRRRGLSRKRLQVSALPRQWIRLFNGLTV